MAVVTSLLLFLAILGAVWYYGYRQYIRPANIIEQVGASALSAEPEHCDTATTSAPAFLIRTIRQVGEKVPISPQDASMTRRYLIAAGYRSETALVTYYGIKVILAAALLITASLFQAYVTWVPILRIVLIAGAGLAGYFGPNLVLEHLVGRRQEKLRFALPDALDLMVVAVEAGVALDQAMQNVARELAITHQELCDEFALVTLEMRAGKRRAEALRNLADRTGQAEIRQLVAVLVQTDRFGTSMADSLRAHSDFLRVQRRQEAEERANKVGVKLVFPIFFCILPSMFIVAGGAAVLQVIKQLIPMMKNFQ